MKITLDFIAAGGNRHPSAADWKSDLLAFGAGNNIALWNPDDADSRGVDALLTGHTDVVNAVRIYDQGSSDVRKRVIISGAADQTIRLWESGTRTNGLKKFKQVCIINEFQGSINTISVLPEAGLYAVGCADGTLKIFSLQAEKGHEWTSALLQTIVIKPRILPLATALARLDGDLIVLTVAGTSSTIQLYSRTDSGFELSAVLAGHEGWIRSLDFVRESGEPGSDHVLASASQDKYIRLWRFQKAEGPGSASFAASNGIVAFQRSLSNKAHTVGTGSAKHSVTFEALLIGHEDWIYTARWAPSNNPSDVPTLLSASADNSLAVWTADRSTGLWVCNTRLGEMSSQKGSTTATGSTGGFWIGLWAPDALCVVSLGRTGSWRRWAYDKNVDMWVQQIGISGHTHAVQSIAWAPDGAYLLSTSSDQTTRIWAEWKRNGKHSWHEFSRPQIHGYDLNCVDTLTPNQIISGADEKLLRVFNKPKAVADLMSRLCGIEESNETNMPDAADVPVLGLSNKAIEAVADDETADPTLNGDCDDREAEQSTSSAHKSTLSLDHPPLEDHLARHTLWPENEKLYGHGYEISCVTASHDGSLVATACRASSIDHAVIRLYETKQWREVKPPLTAHSLTVTSLAFSVDDTFLLSVGRDRQWTVFQRRDHDLEEYEMLVSNPKGHSRMILDCAWAPRGPGAVFATAGRDKSVKVWKLEDKEARICATFPMAAAVTAVAFKGETSAGCLQLAYGTEDGATEIVELSVNTLDAVKTSRTEQTLLPSKAVIALRWRPRTDEASDEFAQLAVASEDGSVRILNVGR